jgi:hypothetical protein
VLVDRRIEEGSDPTRVCKGLLLTPLPVPFQASIKPSHLESFPVPITALRDPNYCSQIAHRLLTDSSIQFLYSCTLLSWPPSKRPLPDPLAVSGETCFSCPAPNQHSHPPSSNIGPVQRRRVFDITYLAASSELSCPSRKCRYLIIFRPAFVLFRIQNVWSVLPCQTWLQLSAFASPTFTHPDPSWPASRPPKI